MQERVGEPTFFYVLYHSVRRGRKKGRGGGGGENSPLYSSLCSPMEKEKIDRRSLWESSLNFFGLSREKKRESPCFSS